MTSAPSNGEASPPAARRYEGLADLPPILAFASAATRARSPLFTSWHPGDIVWALMGKADQPQPNRFWDGRDGVDALAWFVGPGELWLETLPDREGRIADALRWAEDAARQGQDGPAPLKVRAYEADAQRIAALEALGYRKADPEGVTFRMRLDGPLPTPEAPDGVRLGDSVSVDPAQRAAAHRAAWNHLEHLGIQAQSGFSTERYESLRSLPVYDPELDILAAAPDGAFVANCIAWADAESGVGVFEPVGVALAWRGRRLARSVMLSALHRLKDRGLREARVSTAHFNHAAIAAYRLAGSSRRAGRRGGRSRWGSARLQDLGERLRPVMARKQVAQVRTLILPEDDFCLEVLRIDAADEFAADAARRQHEQPPVLGVLPHGDDLRDPVFAGRRHGGDGAALGAQPPARRIDADAGVEIAPPADQRRADVPEEAVVRTCVRPQHAGCVLDEVFVCHCAGLTPRLRSVCLVELW